MKRRLLFLNVALMVLIGLAGWRFRQANLEAREREQKMFGRTFKPLAPPILPPFPGTTPVTAGSYLEVAEKVLFSRDRNPIVAVEAPAVKQMPPLPVFYGLMDLGRGPRVILSEKAGAPNKGYEVGDRIGDFKIAALERSEIEFEWDGKPIRRTYDELKPRPGEQVAQAGAPAAAPQTPAAAAPAPAPAPAAGQGAATVLGGSTAASSVVAGGAKAGPAPGKEGETRGCVDGDNSPAGTVVDGYRKAISNSPFGRICRWEVVN